MLNNFLFSNSLALKAIQSNMLIDKYSEELELLMNLKSERIISYCDAFQEGVLFCILTEYCEVKIEKNKYFAKIFRS